MVFKKIRLRRFIFLNYIKKFACGAWISSISFPKDVITQRTRDGNVSLPCLLAGPCQNSDSTVLCILDENSSKIFGASRRKMT
jgi:hypothetical protein